MYKNTNFPADWMTRQVADKKIPPISFYRIKTGVPIKLFFY